MTVEGMACDAPAQYQINQLQSTSSEFQVMYGRYQDIDCRYRPYQRPVQQSPPFQKHNDYSQPLQQMYSSSFFGFPMAPSLRNVSIPQTPLRGGISNDPYAPSKQTASFAISNQNCRPNLPLSGTRCTSTFMRPVDMEISRHSQPSPMIPTSTPQRRQFAPIQQQSLINRLGYNNSFVLQQSCYGNKTASQHMAHGNQFKLSQETRFQGDITHNVTDPLQPPRKTLCQFSSDVQLPVNEFDGNLNMPQNSMEQGAYQTLPTGRHAQYLVSNSNPVHEAPNTFKMLQTPLRPQNDATVLSQIQLQTPQTAAAMQIPDNQCKIDLGNQQHGMHKELSGLIQQSSSAIRNNKLQSTSTSLYHVGMQHRIKKINRSASTYSQCSKMRQPSSKSNMSRYITNANIVLQENQQVIVPAISTVPHFSDPFPDDDTSVKPCHPALVREARAMSQRPSGVRDTITQRKYDTTFDGITVKLRNIELWKQFANVTMEMMISPGGRRMFPTLDFEISGLNPNSTYVVFLDFILHDNVPLKYNTKTKKWYRITSREIEGDEADRLVCPHPLSPARGEVWNRRGVSFSLTKLSNHINDERGVYALKSQHLYQPRILLTEARPNDVPYLRIFSFGANQFVTVTQYRDPEVSKLKIKLNPCARNMPELVKRAKRENIQKIASEMETEIAYAEGPISSLQEDVFDQIGYTGSEAPDVFHSKELEDARKAIRSYLKSARKMLETRTKKKSTNESSFIRRNHSSISPPSNTTQACIVRSSPEANTIHYATVQTPIQRQKHGKGAQVTGTCATNSNEVVASQGYPPNITAPPSGALPFNPEKHVRGEGKKANVPTFFKCNYYKEQVAKQLKQDSRRETSTNLPVVYVPNTCQKTQTECIQEKSHCQNQSCIVEKDESDATDLSEIFPDRNVHDTVKSQSLRVPEHPQDVPDLSEISFFSELLPDRGMLEELNSEDIWPTDGQPNLGLMTNANTVINIDEILGVENHYPPSNGSTTSTNSNAELIR